MVFVLCGLVSLFLLVMNISPHRAICQRLFCYSRLKYRSRHCETRSCPLQSTFDRIAACLYLCSDSASCARLHRRPHGFSVSAAGLCVCSWQVTVCESASHRTAAVRSLSALVSCRPSRVRKQAGDWFVVAPSTTARKTAVSAVAQSVAK